MATRKQKIKVGIFLAANALILIAAVAVITGWRGAKEVEYHLVFQDSVTGLYEGGRVEYQGVPVGRVTRIRVGSDHLPHVSIHVNPAKVDLRKGVSAKLEIQSLATGAMCVFLFGGDASAPPQDPAELIPTTPSMVQSFSTHFAEMSGDLGVIVKELRAGLHGMRPGELAETVTQLRQTIQEIHRLVLEGQKSLSSTSSSIVLLTEDVRTQLAGVKESREQFKMVMERVAKLTTDLNETVNLLKVRVQAVDPQGVAERLTAEVAAASRSVQQSLGAVDRASTAMVYQTGNVQQSLVRTLDTLNSTLEELRALVADLREDPAALVRGKAKTKEVAPP
jgi:phospholipid/cholesterol/gamma-HCH transport system substrate-binding protein